MMAEPPATIKNKRTVRRGRLTTLGRQLEEQSKQDLRELDIATLTLLQKSIHKDVKLHQDLQTRYEDLICPKEENQEQQQAYEDEVNIGEEHQQTYDLLVTEVDLLIADYNLHKEEERLFSAHNSWAEVANPKAKTFITESRERVAEINDFLKRSERRTGSEIINSGRERLTNLIKQTNKLVHTIREEPVAVPAPREVEHRTKFDIELPHFHGNPMEWESFYSLFSTTIEKRSKHLSSEERCCLLLKSLRDTQARDLAQLNTAGENGYLKAIDALKQRYGQAEVILPQHISNFKSQQTFRFNRDSLLQLGKHHQMTYRSLTKLKVNLSSFMAAYAASQFDDKLSEEWSKFTTTLSGLPTMEDLDAYTQSLVCRLPSASNNSSTHSRSHEKATQQSAAAANKPKPKLVICSLCNESAHSLSKCPVFKEYTPERRGKFVKDKRWCMNCLHPSHVSHNCPSTYTCRHCSGKHHTLLHRGETAPTNSSNNTGAQSSTNFISIINPSQQKQSDEQQELKPPTHSFLNTAMVKAINGGRSRTSRIALDSGSSTSLITEALASHLKLKRHPQSIALEGAYSEGSSKCYVQTTLQSLHDPKQEIVLKLSVVSKLPFATAPSRAFDIASDENVRDLQLADKEFGGRLDILLSSLDVCQCMQGNSQYFPVPKIATTPTIFGWTVTGPLDSGQSSKFLSIQSTKDGLQESLQRLWEIDQVPITMHYTQAEESALQQFEANHSINSNGRYSVTLPRTDSPPVIGSSRNIAISRFLQNERSLSKKGKLADFNSSLLEYQTLDHAEEVPKSELNHKPAYYLPVHGVFKETSTTTKVRPVFDASARTDNGVSLNDLLLAGPNLYPLLTDILVQFRTHRIGFAADISKMFREILIQPSERDLHRFFMRNQEGNIIDFRMKRLTFGVKSSPFLATKVIQHLAEQHSLSHPLASKAILSHFYVDDYLSGTATLKEAVQIREQICELLSLTGMTLRKWRTSSSEFANTIPESLLESETLTLNESPKALGIHWDTQIDVFNVAVPNISASQCITKRSIASEAAKVYDILGLFSPFTIRSKMLLQNLWKQGCDWDQEAPPELQQVWKDWVDELPTIHQHSIKRRYSRSNSPEVHRSLHGFSDASSTAYGGVVYLRILHEDGTTTLSLVMSKARVSPLKALTIPRAELTAAHLLAQLLVYTANLLNIQSSNIHAWTDSTIVLCWLRKTPSSLQTFVANRVANIQSSLPDSPWRHVPTKENPADLLSRGVSASTLTESSLWWEGPSWLSQPPAQWSSQQSIMAYLPKIIPETKVVTLTSIVKHDSEEQDLKLWSKYSSFYQLTRVIAWIYRFFSNIKTAKQHRNLSSTLLPTETQDAKRLIFRKAQSQTFANTLAALKQGRAIPQNSSLARLNVSLNKGLIMVSGRVRQSEIKPPKQVIALSAKSPLIKLFLQSQHNSHHHPGVSSLMAIITENFYIPGLKSALKFLSRTCAICQKAYSRVIQPPMGLLPVERTTPTPPFQVTGLDFAGPFTIKKGHTRRPVLIKAYVCLFVCFSTKAIHLELCSDLSKEAFLAAFRRFCARRGTPTSVHSDNGTNFVGAASEIRQIQHLLNSAQEDISHLSSATDISWHFTPPRAPNFGGLWEAGVKRMKVLLKKQISPHPLTFEELNTILTEVEATLNSRPITPLDSTELSEDLVLTPGHFIIGRPLRAAPRTQASDANITSLKRWNLMQRLQQDLWHSWRAWYIQTLLQRSKWHRASKQLIVGDLVLLKDESLTSGFNWPLARITKLYHGDDGIARTADIFCRGKTYRRALTRFVPLFPPTQQSI